jgi:hypothetical protein
VEFNDPVDLVLGHIFLWSAKGYFLTGWRRWQVVQLSKKFHEGLVPHGVGKLDLINRVHVVVWVAWSGVRVLVLWALILLYLERMGDMESGVDLESPGPSSRKHGGGKTVT